MSDDESRACRAFLERNGEQTLRLARAYARTLGVGDELADILQDAAEALLRQWKRCTPTVRPGAGTCTGCGQSASERVTLFAREVASCDDCLPGVVDDLRRGYLSGILRKLSLRAFRRRRRRDAATLDSERGRAARNALAAGTDVEQEVIGRWAGAELRVALAGLPARHREVLLLRFVEGCEVAEIGRRLGLSPSAVTTTQHRGIRKLRALLPPEVVELFDRSPSQSHTPSSPRSAS